MAQFSKVSFNVPTTNTDGTPLTEALSYVVFIDTVSIPQKSYQVPASIQPVNGVLTVPFAALGFTPVNKTQYFAAAQAVDADGASGLSNVFAFTPIPEPSAPTGFLVG